MDGKKKKIVIRSRRRRYEFYCYENYLLFIVMRIRAPGIEGPARATAFGRKDVFTITTTTTKKKKKKEELPKGCERRIRRARVVFSVKVFAAVRGNVTFSKRRFCAYWHCVRLNVARALLPIKARCYRRFSTVRQWSRYSLSFLHVSVFMITFYS